MSGFSSHYYTEINKIKRNSNETLYSNLFIITSLTESFDFRLARTSFVLLLGLSSFSSTPDSSFSDAFGPPLSDPLDDDEPEPLNRIQNQCKHAVAMQPATIALRLYSRLGTGVVGRRVRLAVVIRTGTRVFRVRHLILEMHTVR